MVCVFVSHRWLHRCQKNLTYLPGTWSRIDVGSINDGGWMARWMVFRGRNKIYCDPDTSEESKPEGVTSENSANKGLSLLIFT